MKGRRTTANSSDRFWGTKKKEKKNEMKPKLMVLQSSFDGTLIKETLQNHHERNDKQKYGAFATKKGFVSSNLYLYYLSLGKKKKFNQWQKKKQHSFQKKASVLTEQNANGGEERSMSGTTPAPITRMCEVYVYILEGWKKISKK